MRLESYINRFFLLGYAGLVFAYSTYLMLNSASSSLNDFSAGYVTPSLKLGILICSALYIFDSFLRYGIQSKFIVLIFLWVGWLSINVYFFFPDGSKGRIIDVFLWSFCFIFGYYISLRYPASPVALKSFFVFFLITMTPIFIHNSTYQSMLSHSKIENYSASVNNIYFLLLTLPWIFLLRNKKMELLLFFVLSGFILISSKRSAAIVLLLVSIPYVFFWMKNSKNKTLNILLLMCGFLIFAVIFSGRFDYVSYRMGSVKEDEGSGRAIIWDDVIKEIKKSPFEKLILGHGYYTVSKRPNSKGDANSAHNDFLEVIYDYGIIGLILYISIYIFLFKRLWFIWKYLRPYFMSYYSGIVIMLVMAMVSHLIIYPTYFIILTTYWGVMEAVIYCQNSRMKMLN